MVDEPIGLLNGRDALVAVSVGVATNLAGGPTAFTMLRQGNRIVPVRDADPVRMAPFTQLSADWAGLGRGPLIMAILNVTPDSFSNRGEHLDPEIAIAAGEQMLADGAHLIDIGGESTRPGSEATAPTLEQARILPVITALSRQGAVISVDTRNAQTMAQALDAGARIVNDVSGLRHDPAAAALVAARGCPVILMHMRGTPATMNDFASYADLTGEVIAELRIQVDAAIQAGISPTAIMLDPGFGFAKKAEHNLQLLQSLPALLSLGRPLVAGISRKNTIGMLSGEDDSSRRGPGSVAAALMALDRGARIVRVHDVRETAQAVRVWQGLQTA